MSTKPKNIKKKIPGPELEFPDRIYGRQDEQAVLQKATRLFLEGNSVLVHISGVAGIGKSFFTHSSFKKASGLDFYSGKYERFQQGIPYVGVAQVVESILGRFKANPALYPNWESNFKARFSPYYWEMRRVIPGLLIHLEKPEEKPERHISPIAWKNRIVVLLKELMRFGIEESHQPIVVHLDDIQWSDFASLEFVQELIKSKISGVMLIVATRTEKTGINQRFDSVLRNISEHATVFNIELVPLRLESVSTILKELFPTTNSEIEELAQVAFEKSAGNPYILNEYLSYLRNKQQISFDSEIHAWNWTITDEAVRQPEVPLIGILTQKLKELNRDEQSVLQICSCFGSNLNIPFIANISNLQQAQIREVFKVAEKRNFVRASDPLEMDNEVKHNYEFVHEIVQNALHKSIQAVERGRLHRDIANYYISSSIIGLDKRDIFEAAYHFNESISFQMTPAEKIEHAKLNLRAAVKAKEAASYNLALNYLQRAMENKIHLNWQNNHEFSKEAHIQGYQIARLNEKSDLARSLFSKARMNCKKQELAELRYHRIMLDIQHGELKSAITTGVLALKDLGIRVPKKAGKLAIGREFLKTKLMMRGRSLDSIYELPELKNEKADMAFKIIYWMFRAAYAINPELNGVLALKQVQLTLKYGTNGDSYSGFMAYGVIIGAGTNNYKQAYEYAELGNRLAVKYKNDAGALDFGRAIYSAYKSPIKETLDLYHTAKLKSYDSGDFLASTEPTVNESLTYLCAGLPLQEVHDKVMENSEMCSNLDARDFYQFQQVVSHHLYELRGLQVPALLTDEVMNILANTEYGVTLGVSTTLKMQLHAIKGQWSDVLSEARKGKKNISFLSGIYIQTEYHFYRALALLENSVESSWIQRLRAKSKIKSVVRKMNKWAEVCEENHSQRRSIIQSLMARENGNIPEAIKLVQSATEEGLGHTIHNRALALQILSDLKLRAGEESEHIRLKEEARLLYEEWGSALVR